MPNAQNIDATLFATEEVPVETAAVDELLGVLGLGDTLGRITEAAPRFFDSSAAPPKVEKVAVTPDFHKASGIPVGTVLATRGFVVPQAVGNDVNCGMRLHTTGLDADAVLSHRAALEARCRRLFFEGGRSIPMTRAQRTALFTGGLEALADATPRSFDEGQWALFHERDWADDLSRIQRRGSLPARRAWALDDLLGPEDGTPTRDTQIGSIGGGNHFVELQYVEKILDGAVAYAWGLKPGQVTVMVHTGSVGIGHLCGGHYRDVVRGIYPKSLPRPANGIFPLPDCGEGGEHRAAFDTFWDALHNAANFAFANRLFLALMAQQALRDVLGGRMADDPFPLLYDAPHNLVWREEDADGPLYLHRKGATPANGWAAMQETPYAFQGEPVLVPGSMGASSFVLVGEGNGDALCSASHGAGRALSRGEAMSRITDAEFAAFLRDFRVVTPLDLRRPDVAARRDIVEQKLAELRQEAPGAYKGIGPVVDTLTRAGIARPVAELRPLMTLKG